MRWPRAWRGLSRCTRLACQVGRASPESRSATAAAVALRYETRNADGNPSYVKWAWEVVGAGTGAKITVTWDCYLKMFDRRVLGGPLQKRQAARVGTDEPPVTAA